jgi:CRISPR-associated protein Csm5
MLDPDWKKAIENLLGGELENLLHDGQAMLIRLGRYGGAESKTLSGDGVAQIKIIEGKGPDGKQKSSYQSATKTVWLAGQTADDQRLLIPFGWTLIEIDPHDELPQLKAWCDNEANRRPNMQAINAEFATARAAASEQKNQQADQRAAADAADQAKKETERRLAAQRLSMTPAQREIEAFRSECEKRAAQLRGNKEKPNAAYHEKAKLLARKALQSADWTAAEKAAAAGAIEEWLPKVVAIDVKELRKKLGLSALKAGAGAPANRTN